MAFNPNSLKGQEISAANSTAALLTGGATFTGAWEDVTNYTTVSSAVLGSLATDGTLYFDVSTDGGTTFASIPSVIGDATFAVPRILNVVEQYVRIRYVNGTTAQTGTFSIQTKYSNGQPISLLASMDGLIKDETPTQVVRAVGTGKTPSGSYQNLQLDGAAFTTIALLADAAVFDSGVLNTDGYTQVQTEITASHNGTLDFVFYEDSAGANEIRSISIPYIAANGYQLYSAPAFGYYVRYKFTNTGGATQTDFFYSTKFLTKGISPQLLAKNGFIAPTMVAGLSRISNDFNTDRNAGLIGGQSSRRASGVNDSVASGALETVWGYSADWIPNQVVNEKLRIRAGGSAADDTAGAGAQTVEVTFLDETWAEVTETLVTAGASASAATTANCVRLLSAEVINVGTYHKANTAEMIFELTGGNIMGNIAIEKGEYEAAIYTVPAGKTMYITEIFVSCGQADSADIKMFVVDDGSDLTTPFKAKHEEWGVEDFSGAQPIPLTTYLKVAEKSDVWFEAQRITGSGTARVSVDFNFFLINN